MSDSIESVTFCVFGPPRPKERARLGRGGRVYTPSRTKQYERAVAEVALMRLGRSWALNGVYRLSVLAVLANNRRMDASNVLKAVEDGLNGIAYHDDSQVMETSARKLVEPRGRERTEVLLERIGDAPRKARRA